MRSTASYYPTTLAFATSSLSDTTSASKSSSMLGRANTSDQLRSTFGCSSSSAYVSRTHLPYVAQSSLIAHCLTSSPSSKSYGSSPTSYRFGAATSTTTSGYHANRSSYTSSTRTSSQLHRSSASGSSRPTYSSSSASSSSAYSTANSSRLASSSRPQLYRRPAPISSYYQPVRLRDRPQLTQISRQLDSPTGLRSDRLRATRLESSAAAATPEHKEAPSEKTSDKEADWFANDLARNISRNKYLIKFREIDKQQATSNQQQQHQQPETREEEEERKQEQEKEQNQEQQNSISATMLIVASESNGNTTSEDKNEAANHVGEQKVIRMVEEAKVMVKSDQVNQLTNELSTKKEAEEDGQQAAAVKKVVKKRNIKVKLKPIQVNQKDENVSRSRIETKVEDPSKLNGKQQVEEKKVRKKKQETSSSQKENVEQLSSSKKKGDSKEAKGVELQTSSATSTLNLSESSKEPKRIRFREYKYDDFNFLTVLGHGGWGFVILAELKGHDSYFAVKCIKKITIVEDDDFDSILIERKVLTLGNVHPFICKLFCTFETPGYLFFAMEYCSGGDLMFHVQREGKFSESRCRFYAAEIICAVKFLHNKHIIYRDLKLDNILLDSQGHIRLVDFGMCQCRTYREEMLPSNFCGTPEYISPEIIKGVPYNHSVDWWSFGVLLYEMAVGKMPFRGNDENELLWNVCYEKIHYPLFLSKELTNLLQLLLEREPTKRMGMATCKAGDIHEQPFFHGIDWRAVEQLRVAPPFVPEVTSKRDVQNFDSDFTESACELSPVDSSTLAKIDQKQFHKFPYTNPAIDIFK